MRIKIDKNDKHRLDNLRRRVNRARDFPANTCPASRYVHLIADIISRGKPVPMLQEEPEHFAESMLIVLEELFKSRREKQAALKG